MARHWPVIVGINQYQFLQPLLFAQLDAIELKDLLVTEAGLPPEQCSLLTDIAPMVYQGAAFPTREVILKRFQQSCDQATAEDTVWFFFSGYGVHWQGQDYLLPIDGDPQKLDQTGIPLLAILELLQGSKAYQRLLILDINRSQSALPHQRLGVPTMELAKQLEIPLLFSCRPNQFSQESLAVRHGLFTEALLEGLRFHGCLTLSQMAAYLNNRVPELCQHHFRPEQIPVSVIPTQHQFLMLVPPQGVGSMNRSAAAETAVWSGAELGSGASTGAVGVAPQPEPLPYGAVAPSPVGVSPEPPARDRELASDDALQPVEGTALEDGFGQSSDHFVSRVGWQRWLLVGAGMLLLGVLLRNQTTFLGGRPADEAPEATIETVEEPPPAPAPAATGTNPAADPPAAGEAGDPLFPAAGEAGAVNPQEALEQARIAIDQQRFGEALNGLNQIPQDQRPEDFAALQEQAQTGYASASRGGLEVLTSARQIIEPLSASLFNDAIEEARQVAVGDEAYDQAQADIARWSQVILDLAQGRAANGDFEAAIAAASLVPRDQGNVYAQAQAEIQQWQQQRVNRQILQDAQGRLQPDQATSFEEAIKLAQQIPDGTPEYETAQQRINQWSQDILVIARARAAAGQLPGAIAAAELVPPGTSAYDQAQEEIQRWRGQ